MPTARYTARRRRGRQAAAVRRRRAAECRADEQRRRPPPRHVGDEGEHDAISRASNNRLTADD